MKRTVDRGIGSLWCWSGGQVVFSVLHVWLRWSPYRDLGRLVLRSWRAQLVACFVGLVNWDGNV